MWAPGNKYCVWTIDDEIAETLATLLDDSFASTIQVRRFIVALEAWSIVDTAAKSETPHSILPDVAVIDVNFNQGWEAEWVSKVSRPKRSMRLLGAELYEHIANIAREGQIAPPPSLMLYTANQGIKQDIEKDFATAKMDIAPKEEVSKVASILDDIEEMLWKRITAHINRDGVPDGVIQLLQSISQLVDNIVSLQTSPEIQYAEREVREKAFALAESIETVAESYAQAGGEWPWVFPITGLKNPRSISLISMILQEYDNDLPWANRSVYSELQLEQLYQETLSAVDNWREATADCQPTRDLSKAWDKIRKNQNYRNLESEFPMVSRWFTTKWGINFAVDAIPDIRRALDICMSTDYHWGLMKTIKLVSGKQPKHPEETKFSLACHNLNCDGTYFWDCSSLSSQFIYDISRDLDDELKLLPLPIETKNRLRLGPAQNVADDDQFQALCTACGIQTLPPLLYTAFAIANPAQDQGHDVSRHWRHYWRELPDMLSTADWMLRDGTGRSPISLDEAIINRRHITDWRLFFLGYHPAICGESRNSLACSLTLDNRPCNACGFLSKLHNGFTGTRPPISLRIAKGTIRPEDTGKEYLDISITAHLNAPMGGPPANAGGIAAALLLLHRWGTSHWEATMQNENPIMRQMIWPNPRTPLESRGRDNTIDPEYFFRVVWHVRDYHEERANGNEEEQGERTQLAGARRI